MKKYIKKGPIHIIKNNHLKKSHTTQSTSLWDLLKNRPCTGKRNKLDIIKQIKNERSSWKE